LSFVQDGDVGVWSVVLGPSAGADACQGRPDRPVRRPGDGRRFVNLVRGRCAVECLPSTCAAAAFGFPRSAYTCRPRQASAPADCSMCPRGAVGASGVLAASMTRGGCGEDLAGPAFPAPRGAGKALRDLPVPGATTPSLARDVRIAVARNAHVRNAHVRMALAPTAFAQSALAQTVPARCICMIAPARLAPARLASAPLASARLDLHH
jgi:hypothetical protein